MDSNTPLAPRDRDLASLAARMRGDTTLTVLAGMAGAIHYPVGLLVNGMTVYGRLVAEKEFAQALDAFNSQVIGLADDSPMVGLWTRAAEKDQKEEEELQSRTEDVPRSQWSEDDERKVIAQRQTVLNIAEAQILQPGSTSPTTVPILRVGIEHVAAWWLLPVNDDGKVSFQHPA
jgi:hypothetical protein